MENELSQEQGRHEYERGRDRAGVMRRRDRVRDSPGRHRRRRVGPGAVGPGSEAERGSTSRSSPTGAEGPRRGHALRRPQRPALAIAHRGRFRPHQVRPLAAAGLGPDRHPPAPRGGRQGPVLVGLHPQRARQPGADGHRADRPGPADGRALPRCLRDGLLGRRRRADRPVGQGRLADRDRGRRGDRGQPRAAPRLLQPGCPLHDADPQHDPRLGRRGDRHPQARRPEPLRRADRQGDEPAGDAGGHLARLAGHDGRRPARSRRPRSSPATRAPTPSAPRPATCPTTSSGP